VLLRLALTEIGGVRKALEPFFDMKGDYRVGEAA
jgi:hypothetical protein